MSIMDFSGKNFLVIGAGISGRAASVVLAGHGGTVTLNDMKAIDTAEQPWPDIEAAGVKLVFGSQETNLLDGMDVVVPSPVISPEIPIMKEAIRRGLPIWSEVEVACRVTDADVIGITGTNGKTTTSYITRAILRKAGYKVGLIGTIQIMIENEVLPIHNTTPDVVELQHTLAMMRDKGMDYVVMEVSSHALDQNRVAGIEFDTAVFTNLTQDHLDYHKTLENYMLAKAKLFDHVSEQGCKQGKTAVVNIDDAAGATMLAHAKCQHLTYAIEKEADLRATDILVHANGAEFVLHHESFGEMALKLHITGIFNVYNVMSAVGAALAEHIDAAVIKEALEAFTAVPGRFELVKAGQDFSIIVDYAHTPDGVENVLKTARKIAKKRIIAVFGCGGDRDRTKRPIMGRLAAELADVVIATSDNPRTEDPEFILSQVEEGVDEAIGTKHHELIVDRRHAIYRAIEMAEKDDIVVILGKGHENYQILKDKTIHFDDKEEARAAVAAKLAKKN